MSVLIGVSASVNGRYSAFTECLGNLLKPDQSMIRFETGIDIGANRNAIVRYALEYSGYEWVWFVDDDMTFLPTHLQGLISWQQPVVASLYLNRKPPHYPMAFNATEIIDGQRQWRPVSLSGAPNRGLAEIIAAGTGGMIVSTDVFRAIDYDTWFDHHQSTDDLAFCQRVVKAGFPIYLDLESKMGHISTYEVWPQFQQQQGWTSDIRFTSKDSITVQLGD